MGLLRIWANIIVGKPVVDHIHQLCTSNRSVWVALSDIRADLLLRLLLAEGGIRIRLQSVLCSHVFLRDLKFNIPDNFLVVSGVDAR